MTGEPADGAQEEDVSSRLRDIEDRYLRLRADFDNYKRRAAQEQQGARRIAAIEVAPRLLPVLDDAERAMEQVPEGTDETWLRGIRLTVQKLRDVLASLGVERIAALGERFDPEQHEAIAADESSDQPEDTVVAELRPGYRIQDRVLRPTLVRVARRSTRRPPPPEASGARRS